MFFRWRHQNSFALGFSSLGKQGYCEFSSDRHLFDQCMSYFWNPWACPSFSFLFLSFLYILPIFAVSFAMYPTEWPKKLLLRFYSHRHPHRFLKDPINVLPQRRQWHGFSNFWLYLYGSRCRLTMSSYSLKKLLLKSTLLDVAAELPDLLGGYWNNRCKSDFYCGCSSYF